MGAAAEDTFRLCGANATGFIRTRQGTVCLRGAAGNGSSAGASSQTAPSPAKDGSSGAGPVVTAGTNTRVDDALNSADMQFRQGRTQLGCGWVSNAILAANSRVSGGVSANQKEQLREYATRCNLRY